MMVNLTLRELVKLGDARILEDDRARAAIEAEIKANHVAAWDRVFACISDQLPKCVREYLQVMSNRYPDSGDPEPGQEIFFLDIPSFDTINLKFEGGRSKPWTVGSYYTRGTSGSGLYESNDIARVLSIAELPF